MKTLYPHWVIEWTKNKDNPAPEVDKKAIFVGGLDPYRVTEQMVNEKFSEYGEIVSLSFINPLEKEMEKPDIENRTFPSPSSFTFSLFALRVFFEFGAKQVFHFSRLTSIEQLPPLHIVSSDSPLPSQLNVLLKMRVALNGTYVSFPPIHHSPPKNHRFTKFVHKVGLTRIFFREEDSESNTQTLQIQNVTKKFEEHEELSMLSLLVQMYLKTFHFIIIHILFHIHFLLVDFHQVLEQILQVV